jgi:UDP-2-acetamido-3-amino-2,3-dideoxy-glucuronate N-acetyltransferase
MNSKKENMMHKTSDVQTKNIGEGTMIWQFCVILKGAEIGSNCNINAFVFIENNVKIGNDVTIKPGVQIWDGITIEDGVFIGPNVTFTNDLIPRSKNKLFKQDNTIIKTGASIGANATILAGINVGEYAMIGAGSVVTKSIGKNELWIGVPARHVGYVTEQDILDLNLVSKKGSRKYKWVKGKLLLNSNNILNQ